MAYVPVPGLQAQALPASGNWYTTATALYVGNWREVHSDTSLSFRVAYTAHASSTTGYPKARAVWIVTDETGADVEMYDPVVNSTITVSGETGTVKQYRAEVEMVELTDAAAGEASFVAFTPPRWATKIRIELAEKGDTANPGTVSVAMLGGV